MSGSPFEVRALIEGFYGVFYTHPERLSLLRFLGRHHYNLYLYAPKNDRQHRSRWREPYPARQLRQFGEARACAEDSGLDFCYALSPGVDVCYCAEAEFTVISEKLERFLNLGVTSFSLLLDDIRREFSDPRDADAYPSLAAAQADLCNRVHTWLLRQDPRCRLSMCPTDYHGVPPFSAALHELGDSLQPGIDVFYTGRDVCSPTIDRPEVEAFAAALRRKPILWDNYPVNDLAMHGELHLGPSRGRAAELAGAVRGFAVNPMNQAEASKVALATYGDYFTDPGGYDPDGSWRLALRELAGEQHDQLRLVAENSLHSCLGTLESARLDRLVAAATKALTAKRPDAPEVGRLSAYLCELDEACYSLRYRLENLELRNELLPWLEQLERWSWLGRWSVEALTASSIDPQSASAARRIEEYLELVDLHPKRIGGAALRPLARLALESFETVAVA